MNNRRFAVAVGTAALLIGMLPASVAATVAGAGFTTFVAGDEDDCFDNTTGINCNNYADKESVFMSGGPSAAGLSDGDYYFAVLTPGSQNGGAADGAAGNLSDTTVGGTTGDAGSGDLLANRTFTVTGHEITAYGGTHATGVSPNGRAIIGLAPFDDTDNPGGVYILAICEVGSAAPQDCKFDAFRIQEAGVVNFGVVSGLKYYDANENGQFDAGEEGLPDWPIDWSDGISGTTYTDANGEFSLQLVADTYTFAEQQANSPWVQTGNTVDQSSDSGGNSTSLNSFVYTITVVDNGQTTGLNFGNVCRITPGGRTIGFWSNKNGLALLTAADFAELTALHLVNANGSPRDFTATLAQNKTAFKDWLLGATATNMAYMLSAQLAGTVLNISHGFTDPAVVVTAGGDTVQDIIDQAEAALTADGLTLAGDPNRALQETLKNILDAVNNNQAFTQPTPETCPTPVFPS